MNSPSRSVCILDKDALSKRNYSTNKYFSECLLYAISCAKYIRDYREDKNMSQSSRLTVQLTRKSQTHEILKSIQERSLQALIPSFFNGLPQFPSHPPFLPHLSFFKHTKHTPALEFLHKLFPVHGNSSWRDIALSFRSRLRCHLVTLFKIANSTPTPSTPYLSLSLLTFHHST